MTAFASPIGQIRLASDSALSISGLTWKLYEEILGELGQDRSTRVAYHQGVLEIRMPGEFHEVVNRLLAKIIAILSIELNIEVNDFGSVTLNRQHLDRGIEPDSCFYIQRNHPQLGGDQRITETLPPDLVIEVDIANSSSVKLQSYQAMGVSEVWLFQRNRLSIKQLTEGSYQDVSDSQLFPFLSSQQLNQWIEARTSSSDLTVLRQVKAFCQIHSN